MTLQKKNMIKAIFLLMVFSLNTLAGFACSLGVDMGYNSEHHKHDKHAHEKGHKHEAGHSHSHSHYKYSGPGFSKPTNDCCSNQVNSFALLDKSIVHNNLSLKVPIFYIFSVLQFIREEKEEPGISVNSRFQFVRRSCSLDDTDIRISIQSFQI
jgi:hypothetical protein